MQFEQATVKNFEKINAPLELYLNRELSLSHRIEVVEADCQISELKELNFLALPNNKDLQSLPECLINLTDLAFINLKDSNPNVEIPPKLKERLTDEGMGFYYFD
jgi:hypothetical protein